MLSTSMTLRAGGLLAITVLSFSARIAAAEPNPAGNEPIRDLRQLIPDRKVMESIIKVDGQPLDIALAPDGKTIFVSHHSGSISVIRENRVVRKKEIGPNLTDLALTKDGRRLYVGMASTGEVAVVDTESFEIVKRYKVGDWPIGLRLSPDETYLAAVNYNSNSVSIVALASGEVTSVPVGSNPYYVAIMGNSRRLYVANYGSHDVSVVDVDAETLKPKRVKNIKVGANPLGITLTPDEKTMYVANWGEATVSAIAVDSLRVVATHKVGAQPYAIGVDPKGAFIIVSNFGSDHLDVIYATGKRTIVRAKDAVISILISKDGKKIYTTNWSNNLVGIIE